MADLKKDTQEMLDIADVAMGKHTGSDFDRMTPDEAYAESVRTSGRAPNISDAQDEAARIPEAEMQQRRAAAGGLPPDQGEPTEPTTTPTEPTATPGEQPQTTIGEDGKGRTTFGSYVRVVDQNTGEVSWEDTNGRPVAAPRSQQMMEKMNQGLRPKGDLSWDDALKQQSFENVGKAQQYARNAIEANRLAIENRRKGKAKQNAKVADEMGSAFANLQDNLGYVAQHVAGGGSIEDSGAYRSKDGNYYVRGIVAVERLGEFNKEMAELGGKDSMERIVVSQQVSKTTGKPIGEPTFAALYRKNGIDGRGDGVYAKKLNLAQAVNYARMAQVALGKMSDQEAKEYAVWAFGGKNPLNWNVKKPDAIDPKMAIESGKLGVEQDKQRLEWAKFHAKQNNGPAWNKDQHEAMTKMLDSLMFTTDAVTGDKTPREMTPDEQNQANFLRGQIMRGFGYNPPAPNQPQQPQQPQYTEEDRAAAIAKLRERGVNFDASNGSGQGSQYGLRNDGKTYKGTGWLGELRLPDGGVATEYTMQSDAVRDANGNRIDFPTLVPTLTKAEQDLMVNDIIPNRKPVPDEIAQKAVDFARMRLANGQSVFANDGKPPAGATKPPAGATKPPAGETKPPAGETKQPAGETKQPVAETPKPNLETQDPNLGTQKPNLETQAPKKGTVQKRTSADVRREMAARGKATAETPVQKPNGETGALESEITKSGGTWTEDDEGRRTIEIGNWDYLPPDVKERFPKMVVETDDKDLEFDKIRDWQILANERKAEYEAKREKERKRFEKSLANRNLTARRIDVLIEKHLKEWDVKNDPRRMKSASSERARTNDSLSMSM